MVLTWLGDPIPRDKRKEVKNSELVIEEVQECSDGSRRDRAGAGANTADVEYLGRYATVMGAELQGICLSWDKGH